MNQDLDELLEFENHREVSVVRFLPSMLTDESTVQSIHSELLRRIEDGSIRLLAFDMKKLRFVSSSALGMLVGLCMLLNEQGGRLRMYGLNSTMLELIQVSNLQKMLGVCDSEENALSSLQAR